MVWKINNNCQIFIEKTDSIAGRQKEIIPHVSAYYVDKYTTISEKGVKTGSNRLCGTANQELLAGYMLYKYLGISSDEQLVRNEHGKPEIAAGYKNESAAFFNLAHSGPYVVLAISDRPVGVDIEQTKRMSFKVAKRIMRKEQLDRLEGFENESEAFQIELTKYWTQYEAFQIELTKYWTQYEAIMKLVGTGFSGELDDKTMEAYEKRVVFRELEDYVIAVVTE